jgi:hypothetical protein
MSVIMTFTLKGNPDDVERVAGENKEKMREIADRAVEHGVIAHRFYGSEDQVMVVDEWPDEQSFQTFFAKIEAEIGPMMQDAGITSEPEIRFWRKLETHDDVGWGA